ATVVEPDGRTLPDHRVEWTLDPGGAARFVALGERGSFDCLNHLQGLPKKVNSVYAINTTAVAPMYLDGGTPAPNDDIVVQPGQAWVSVVSPAEGISHVTAFSPAVQTWIRR